MEYGLCIFCCFYVLLMVIRLSLGYGCFKWCYMEVISYIIFVEGVFLMRIGLLLLFIVLESRCYKVLKFFFFFYFGWNFWFFFFLNNYYILIIFFFYVSGWDGVGIFEIFIINLNVINVCFRLFYISNIIIKLFLLGK